MNEGINQSLLYLMLLTASPREMGQVRHWFQSLTVGLANAQFSE